MTTLAKVSKFSTSYTKLSSISSISISSISPLQSALEREAKAIRAQKIRCFYFCFTYYDYSGYKYIALPLSLLLITTVFETWFERPKNIQKQLVMNCPGQLNVFLSIQALIRALLAKLIEIEPFFKSRSKLLKI